MMIRAMMMMMMMIGGVRLSRSPCLAGSVQSRRDSARLGAAHWRAKELRRGESRRTAGACNGQEEARKMRRKSLHLKDSNSDPEWQMR